MFSEERSGAGGTGLCDSPRSQRGGEMVAPCHQGSE